MIKPLTAPFFATMRDGLLATAHQNKLGVTVQAAVGLEDAAGQASALASLVGQDAGCYVLNPIDPTNLVPSLQAIHRGTPIVNVESPIDRDAAGAVGAQITTYIGTDNLAAGHLAADAMARFVRRGARVVLVAGIPGDAGSTARTRGFIEGAGGRFEVAQTVAADFDRSQANLAAGQLLRTTRVDGFFAVNDEMALGVAEAVRAAGMTGNVPVIGVDGIAEALAAVRRGAMAATVARYPFTMGQLGVEACLAALRGKQVPESVTTPIQLVTGENVAHAQMKLPHPTEPFNDPLRRLLNS